MWKPRVSVGAGTFLMTLLIACTQAGPPQGSAAISDPAADPAASLDITLEPYVDVRRVELAVDSTALTVTWTLTGPPPEAVAPDDLHLQWTITLQPRTMDAVTVEVTLLNAEHPWGTGWKTFLHAETGETRTERSAGPSPTVRGRMVEVRVPLEDIGTLPASFHWEGGAGIGGRQDRFPNEVPLDERRSELYTAEFPSGRIVRVTR